MSDDRSILLDLYRTAVEAAAPAPALAAALADVPAQGDRVWLLALGKAASPLAEEAVAQLQSRGQDPAGGLIVTPEPANSPHPALMTVVGDHPLPGPRSIEAADAVERTVREVGLGDEVWVLLSGGTSSLIASPVRGLEMDDLRATYDVLLRSGVDIVQMNRIRKRFSRWGGGRLAQVLAHARVRVFVVSDVFGDDVSIVGSGPFSPDPTNAGHIRALIAESGITGEIPSSILDFVDRTERGMIPETPKPGDAAFRDVNAVIIANSEIAIDAAAARAYELGFAPRIRRKPVRGEAARAGEKMARRMLEEDLRFEDDDESEPFVLLCGGEPAVTLNDAGGRGGRCQEFALSASRILAGVNDRHVTLLAAGTDGRDGPTDAAGAIVDETTWSRIRNAGRDPGHDLDSHNAYAALEAADALLRTGLTRTNVMDVFFAIART